MSNSKALQLVENNIIKRVNKIKETDLSYNTADKERNRYSFNHHLQNFILIQKKINNSYIKYFITLERFIHHNMDDSYYFLCVVKLIVIYFLLYHLN